MNIKPLRDLVLIEQEEVVQEEKRDSGIILLKSSFNLYGWDSDETRAQDLISRRKQNKGVVVAVSDKCSFLQKGDNVIYKKQSEQKKIDDESKVCVFVSEANVLCKVTDLGLFCHPDSLIIKISKESRESVFTKKIKRDDGSYVDLFMYNPTGGKDSENHDKHFVASGIVVSVGENIKNVHQNDIALLDYRVDNDDDIIVGYDGEDKLVVTSPITQYAQKEEWVYANRRTETDRKKKSYGHPLCPHDIQIGKVGDYENMSPILGVLRGQELISFDPYVFLVHESTIIQKVSASGLLYSEDEKILQRKVLASSLASQRKYGISAGLDIVCDDFDIFDIVFEGRRISAINDVDIIMVK